MRAFINYILSAVFFILLISCKKTTKNNTTYTPTCSGVTPSYSLTVKPLIQNYCVNCHSNYSSYSQINVSASSIRSSIVNGSMPKGNSLSVDQKNSIICWIDGGAQNN
jgi:uncharacterized membrane protein